MATTTYQRARGWLVDLTRNVRNKLQQEHGGTGNAYGYGTAVVLPFSNGAGAALSIGTLVKLKGTFDDNRVIATTSASDPLVVGVVVGSYVDDDGINFQPVAPADNVQAAVMVAGLCYVNITGSVTRNQYAFSSSTSGAATSSATFGVGAFGVFIASSSSSQALVVLGTAGASGGSSTSFATPSIVLGTAAAAGAASTTIRSDATILAFDATTPAASPLGGSGSVGAAAVAARRDHVHAVTGALDALSDVAAPTPASGDALVYNGSAWVNQAGSAAANIWRPVMATDGTDWWVVVDADGTALMGYSPA